MRCPNCQKEIASTTAKFCPYCGQTMIRPAAPSQGAQAQNRNTYQGGQPQPQGQNTYNQSNAYRGGNAYGGNTYRTGPDQGRRNYPVQEKKKSGGPLKMLLALLIFVGIAGVGYSVYNLFLSKDKATDSQSVTAERTTEAGENEDQVVAVEKKEEKETVKEEAAENPSEEESVEETAAAVTGEADEAAVKEEAVKEDVNAEPAKTEKKKSSGYGKYKLVNTDYLTLRSSATMNDKSNKLMKIPADSEVKVLEVGINGYWKVDYKGTEGYILPSYLEPSDGAVAIKKKGDYEIITDYVTLRDIPSTEGEEKMKITTGAVVEYYDTADNGFILVSYQGQMGYILKKYNGETLVKKVD